MAPVCQMDRPFTIFMFIFMITFLTTVRNIYAHSMRVLVVEGVLGLLQTREQK